MGLLSIGLILFFAVHCVSIINENWRDRVVLRLGPLGWKGLYSLIAVFGFVLIIIGYAAGRPIAGHIYTPAPWLEHLAMLLMLPVFPLLVATYFPGRISHWIRHPMLVATILWAASHLLVNGRSVDLLLFGSFLIWALADLWSMKKRTSRQHPSVPDNKWNDVISIVGGLVIYGLFLVWLHGVLVGVPLIGEA